MNTQSIAAHLDLIDWYIFFRECTGVNDMYAKFVECCRFLIDKFTPTFESDHHAQKLCDYITRLKRIIAIGSSHSPSLARKLLKATNRHRVLVETRLDFKDARSFFA